MPISMDEYREPRFIKYKEGATLARDDRLRFMTYDNTRSYGRVNMSQLGYNAQNPSRSILMVRLNTDEVKLPRR